MLARLIAAGGLEDSYKLRLALCSISCGGAQVQRLLPDAEVIEGDLTDPDYLRRLTKDVNVMFHIAGIGKSPALVSAAAKNSVRRIVLVHTTGIYSKYKAAGEWYRQADAEITALCRERGIGLTVLRPTMIYGTLEDQNIVKFIKDLFRIIADELGVSRKYLGVPFPIAYAGAWCICLLSLTKVDIRKKVQRLCESRAYPYGDAVQDFGYDPMPFEEGLRQEVREYLAA